MSVFYCLAYIYIAIRITEHHKNVLKGKSITIKTIHHMNITKYGIKNIIRARMSIFLINFMFICLMC